MKRVYMKRMGVLVVPGIPLKGIPPWKVRSKSFNFAVPFRVLSQKKLTGDIALFYWLVFLGGEKHLLHTSKAGPWYFLAQGFFPGVEGGGVGGGYSQKIGPLLRTITLFMAEICDIPYPIYDLTKNLKLYLWPDSFIKILFQTCIIISSLVQTNVKLP